MSVVDIRGSTVEQKGRTRWRGGKTTARLCALVGAGVLLAACGSGNGASGGGSAGAGSGGGTNALAVQEHSGLGTILVDSSGKTLYFTDQDANGKISCVDQCLSFWFPVAAKDGKAPTVSGVTDLTVVHRPDNNQDQLAYQGKPLYTFKQDGSAGDVSGDNFMDSFGGVQFHWHVATVSGASGAPAPAPSSGGNTGGGYGGGGY